MVLRMVIGMVLVPAGATTEVLGCTDARQVIMMRQLIDDGSCEGCNDNEYVVTVGGGSWDVKSHGKF